MACLVLQAHGLVSMLTLDWAGIGICAKSNIDELFNFTIHRMRAAILQTHTELHLQASVQSAQLDNQMIGANNPVVLSPAVPDDAPNPGQRRARKRVRPMQMQVSTQQLALVGAKPRVLVPAGPSGELGRVRGASAQVRNGAGTRGRTVASNGAGRLRFDPLLDAFAMRNGGDAGTSSPIIVFQMVYMDTAGRSGNWKKSDGAEQSAMPMSGGVADKGPALSAGIVSYRQLLLHVAPMDFMAEQVRKALVCFTKAGMQCICTSRLCEIGCVAMGSLLYMG